MIHNRYLWQGSNVSRRLMKSSGSMGIDPQKGVFSFEDAARGPQKKVPLGSSSKTQVCHGWIAWIAYPVR